MDTNTTQVIEAFGNKLDQYLNVLAEKAGVATDHFWPVFIRQQSIEGYMELLSYIIVVVVGIWIIRVFQKNLPLSNERDPIVALPAFVKCLLAVAAIFLLSIAFTVKTDDLGNSIGKIINPEYSAVQSLVRMVK